MKSILQPMRAFAAPVAPTQYKTKSAERYIFQKAALFGLFLLLLSGKSVAQFDISGSWRALAHEDQPERGPGPDIMEYVGLPINTAARMAGMSWDPAQLAMTEFQCRPHPSDYGSRHSNFRIWQEVESASQKTLTWKMRREWMEPQRTIYMDERTRPGDAAAHTWQGFSLGGWDGNMLNILTTDLKRGYIRRNGIPRSDLGQLQESYIRHDEFLTVISVVSDPIYLTEPFIRSSNYRLDPALIISPYPCDPAVEIQRDRGHVPHYLPGQNPFGGEYAERYGIQSGDSLGGAATMYPE
jgi:hypothetical protein